jgi:hypothetical protein
MTKKKKILIILYLVFITFSFFYVKNVLKEESVGVYQREIKKVEEEYPVNVTFRYYDNNNVREFKETLKNTDTIDELLQLMRKKNILTYETNKYTYGTEIESINNIKPPINYKWVVFTDGNDVTIEIGSRRLEDNKIYELKMVEK